MARELLSKIKYTEQALSRPDIRNVANAKKRRGVLLNVGRAKNACGDDLACVLWGDQQRSDLIHPTLIEIDPK